MPRAALAIGDPPSDARTVEWPVETGDLESVGYIRRAHISMSFARMMRYARQSAAETKAE